MTEVLDPTLSVPIDFGDFVRQREQSFATRVEGGVPDYAFSWDWTIRRQLDAIGPLRWLAEAMCAGTVPVQRAMQEANAVAVGPDQFPQVHAMGVRCAETLGIGIPQLFIMQEPRVNAFTFATGEVDQIVVLTSGLLETCDSTELLTVIGHECGHIHNRHVVYNTLWEVLTNDLARGLLTQVLAKLGRSSLVISLIDMVFTVAVKGIFMRWHRCAEITCDRAGLICAGDVEASKRLHGKLAMGHIGQMEGFNSEAYKHQLKTFSKSAMKIMELFLSHPLGPVRAQAIEAFLDCETLHGWRPELRTAPARPRAEVDDEIAKLFL